MDEKRHRIRPDRTRRARDLRQHMTVPERLLWGRLRNGRLGGLKFRRQHPIGPFVADYYCAEARLVIEIDGMSHDNRVAEDASRTKYLEASGLRVLRYSNDDVLRHLDAVVTNVAKAAGLEV